MSQVKISGNASGTGVFEVAAPNSNTNYTLTLPTATTTLVGTDATQTLTNKTLGSGLVAGASLITSGTVQASTSGTSIAFTSIPSWVKRITLMFQGVSTSGTSLVQVQFGTGVTPTYVTTGYASAASVISTGTASVASTTGFQATGQGAAADVLTGNMVFTNLSGNSWTESGLIGYARSAGVMAMTAGSLTLGDVLTAIRITTVNGTDTFDAGSINILYE
jgi:hypothetical protein